MSREQSINVEFPRHEISKHENPMNIPHRKYPFHTLKICLIASIVMMLTLSSCRHSPEIPVTPVLTFDQDISPIVLKNCATSWCHDGLGRKLPLVSYENVMHYVTAGKPYQSKLFSTITSLTGNNMPPKGPMSDDQIKTIYIWILQGAKEN